MQLCVLTSDGEATVAHILAGFLFLLFALLLSFVSSCIDFCSESYYILPLFAVGLFYSSFFQLFQAGSYIIDLRLYLPLF